MATDRWYVTENRGQLERLRALVDKLGDRELATPMDAGWTVAGVLAHLAFWDYRIVALLDAWGPDGRGAPPPRFDEAAVNWINDAAKPFLLALAPRQGAELALAIAETVDRKIETLGEDVVDRIAAAGGPVNFDRAEHRREHLDEIEAALRR